MGNPDLVLCAVVGLVLNTELAGQMFYLKPLAQVSLTELVVCISVGCLRSSAEDFSSPVTKSRIFDSHV